MARSIDLSKTEVTENRQTIDVFLQPGQSCWADRYTRMHTILGSCVAVCLYHEALQVGGMNHIQMPGACPTGRSRSYPAKYADDAMALLMEGIADMGLKAWDFRAKVFGGGSLLSGSTNGVGLRNFESVLRFLKDARIPLLAQDLGGTEHRKIVFDVATGDVWMRRYESAANDTRL